MPIDDEGWQLFSCVVSNDADNIYSHVIDTIIDVKETNYDLENEAWLLPLNGLDGLITSAAKLCKAVFRHFKAI